MRNYDPPSLKLRRDRIGEDNGQLLITNYELGIRKDNGQLLIKNYELGDTLKRRLDPCLLHAGIRDAGKGFYSKHL